MGENEGVGGSVGRGREAFARQDWAEAYDLLSAAGQLERADLERLATAAYLIGKDGDSAEVWARAYQECLRLGETPRAARCAFWLALALLLKGDMAQGGGWLGRAHRLLEDTPRDCAEQGYLLVPAGLRLLAAGDAAAAYATFGQAAKIGDLFGERDLVTMGQLGQGQALVQLGEFGNAASLLDEVMVAVVAGEVSSIVAGIVYCAVIEACHAMFDLRRAHEWTTALTHWCAAQPDLVPYRGQCLVYRAEVMQLHGAWSDALKETRQACTTLAQQPAAGMALYRLGELHRLRGEVVAAEDAYRQANRCGRTPQPGLALLRLAQGDVGAAEASIRTALDDAHNPAAQSSLLAAQVDITLAANDVPAARVAADQLARIAADVDAPLLRAMSAHAEGATILAEGDARSALVVLRRAWQAWRELEAPYDAGRARVMIGQACRQTGDEDTAQLEYDAAREIFRELGAAPDLAEVERRSGVAASSSVNGLTRRESQVLALVAVGKSNRDIAAELFLSEKTVARHVSNILAKLGMRSRSAATAYAHEHHLV
ncbi:LuxR C-terminal-related transcriptional regulator [Kribbella sp. NBC_01245]|uniref:helix-turn-helix transcriptional regulator n=1 Tax=Kribbella sp. NBC_01245 TaxID=2903578 RepID=UPI002E289D20|nr:LuxR C-terminal-related transcriptional regulator [Kribbella sp. NBC_01245]